MSAKFHFADVDEVIAKFPATADTLLVDAYLSDRPDASIRLFRLYDELAAHHHKQCDELLYLLRGRVRFEIEGEPPRELSAGQLVVFLRNVVHAVTPIGTEPAIFLSADTPRRDPRDVHFTDPAAAKGKKFVAHLPGHGPEAGGQ